MVISVLQRISLVRVVYSQMQALILMYQGGIAPYSYSWSTGDTTEDLSNVTAGSYTVMIIDSANCVTNKTLTVPFDPGPVSLSVTENTTLMKHA